MRNPPAAHNRASQRDAPKDWDGLQGDATRLRLSEEERVGGFAPRRWPHPIPAHDWRCLILH